MRGLFVTGTDTGVGKTFLCAHLARSLRRSGQKIGAYKPVCSGANEFPGSESPNPGEPTWADIDSLSLATDQEFAKEKICPQRFLHPLAPPVAAEREQRVVDEKLLETGLRDWSGCVDGMLIEGVGGWKCPISKTTTIEDFAKAVGFPVLIVAAHKLGVINHTLLTLEAVRQAGLSVAGVVLNCIDTADGEFLESNIEQIQRFAEIPFVTVSAFEHAEELRCHQTSDPIDWWNAMQESTTNFFTTT